MLPGSRSRAVNASLLSVVPGRRVDDDCTALLRLDNGAHGVLMASQIAAGEGNGLRLRVYGERGSLDWKQEDPNRLRLKDSMGPKRFVTRPAATWVPTHARLHACLGAIRRVTWRPSLCSIVSSPKGSLHGRAGRPIRCRRHCPGSLRACGACSSSTVRLRAAGTKSWKEF